MSNKPTQQEINDAIVLNAAKLAARSSTSSTGHESVRYAEAAQRLVDSWVRLKEIELHEKFHMQPEPDPLDDFLEKNGGPISPKGTN